MRYGERDRTLPGRAPGHAHHAAGQGTHYDVIGLIGFLLFAAALTYIPFCR